MDMMDEFELDDLHELRDFIFENSLQATLERLRHLPRGSFYNELTVDGYDEPVTMKLRLDVSPQGVLADFEGTSGLSKKGINVPLVYTTAYACYALKCTLAPQIPNNHASLAPFKVSAPVNCILNAVHPAPVAIRHVLGQFLPDVVLGALHKMLPDTVPAEGSSALWNVQLGARPIEAAQAAAGETLRYSQILMFKRHSRPVCTRCHPKSPSMWVRLQSGARSCARVRVAPAGSAGAWGRSSKFLPIRVTASISMRCLTAASIRRVGVMAGMTALRARFGSTMAVTCCPRASNGCPMAGAWC
jgi:hypothetical protein